MATNKPVIKVYVDPDIDEWLATKATSAGSRSALINKILRAERGREASNQPPVPQTDQCSDEPTIISLTASLKEAKRFIDNFEIDIIEYDKQITALEQWQEQSEEQLNDLNEWKQSLINDN